MNDGEFHSVIYEVIYKDGKYLAVSTVTDRQVLARCNTFTDAATIANTAMREDETARFRLR